MRLLFFAFALLLSFHSYALEVETISPKHRSAAELAEIAHRMAGAGIVVAAFGEKIVVRGENKKQIREVRALIEKLDTPAKQWRVDVRGGGTLTREGSEFGLRGVQESTKNRKRKEAGSMIVRSGAAVALAADGNLWRISPQGGGGASILLKVERLGKFGAVLMSTEVTAQSGAWTAIGGISEASEEERGEILHRGSGKRKQESEVEIRLVEIKGR